MNFRKIAAKKQQFTVNFLEITEKHEVLLCVH